MTPERHAAIRKWMRILHHDIGFFVLSLTLIYVCSGMILTFRDTNFLKTLIPVEKTIQPGLKGKELTAALRLKRMKILSEDEESVRFSVGDHEGGRDCRYDRASGLVSYTLLDYPPALQALNGLHKTASAKVRHWFTLLYACCLLFLAVSAFWMYPPRSRQFWRGTGLFALGLFFAGFLLTM